MEAEGGAEEGGTCNASLSDPSFFLHSMVHTEDRVAIACW